jgi:hypothetical protein
MRHRPQVIDRCVQRVAATTLFPPRVSFILAPFFSPNKKIGGKVQIFRIQYMGHRPQEIDRCVQRVAAPTLFPHPRGSVLFGAIFSPSKKIGGKVQIFKILPGWLLTPPPPPPKADLFSGPVLQQRHGSDEILL